MQHRTYVVLILVFSAFSCKKTHTRYNPQKFTLFLASEASASIKNTPVNPNTSYNVLKGPEGLSGPKGLDGVPGIPGENGEKGTDDTCGSTSNNVCQSNKPAGITSLTSITLQSMPTLATSGAFPVLQYSSSDSSLIFDNTRLPNGLWMGFFEQNPLANNHMLTTNGVVDGSFLTQANTIAHNGAFFAVVLGKGSVVDDLKLPFGSNTLAHYLVQAGATEELLEATPDTVVAFIGMYGIGRGNGAFFKASNSVVTGSAVLADEFLFKTHTPTSTQLSLNHILPLHDLTPCHADDLLHWEISNQDPQWSCASNEVLTDTHFLTRTITGEDIENQSIIQNNVSLQSIETRHIMDESLVDAHFQNGSILAKHIHHEAIESRHIKNLEITSRHFSSNSVTANAMSPLIIQSVHIQENAVSSRAISNNAIRTVHTTSSSILERHIANNTLQDDVFSTNSVTPQKFVSSGGIFVNGALVLVGNAPYITLNKGQGSGNPSLRIGNTSEYISWVVSATNTLQTQNPSRSLASIQINGELHITNNLQCEGCIQTNNLVNSVTNEHLSPPLKMFPGMCIFSFERTTCPQGWTQTNTGFDYNNKAIGISNSTTTTQIENQQILTTSETSHNHAVLDILSTGFLELWARVSSNENSPTIKILIHGEDGVSELGDNPDQYSNGISGNYFTQSHTHSHAVTTSESNVVWPNHYKVIVCCHE